MNAKKYLSCFSYITKISGIDTERKTYTIESANTLVDKLCKDGCEVSMQKYPNIKLDVEMMNGCAICWTSNIAIMNFNYVGNKPYGAWYFLLNTLSGLIKIASDDFDYKYTADITEDYVPDSGVLDSYSLIENSIGSIHLTVTKSNVDKMFEGYIFDDLCFDVTYSPAPCSKLGYRKMYGEFVIDPNNNVVYNRKNFNLGYKNELRFLDVNTIVKFVDSIFVDGNGFFDVDTGIEILERANFDIDNSSLKIPSMDDEIGIRKYKADIAKLIWVKYGPTL